MRHPVSVEAERVRHVDEQPVVVHGGHDGRRVLRQHLVEDSRPDRRRFRFRHPARLSPSAEPRTGWRLRKYRSDLSHSLSAACGLTRSGHPCQRPPELAVAVVGRFTWRVSAPAEVVTREAGRRRTFAIISHPDAGKTTLTEKFLLYGGAVQDAGQVKARGERRRVRSDWMDMEQQRGISITSTVMQFPYRDQVLNLLDTPGHRDFSEDTYRVLAAADAAIMVLDASSGIEPQTLKLFEVCRERRIPLITFVNKWDRPGKEALELTDEIEDTLDLATMPITWPVGIAGDFRGLIDKRSGDYIRFTRTARGATEAGEEVLDPERALEVDGDSYVERGGTDRAARGGRQRLRPRAVRGRPRHARVLRLRPHQLRGAPAARRGGRPRPVTSAATGRGRHGASARRSLLRLRVQGAGQHGSVAPGPDRLRTGLLRSLRAGRGHHPRTHRQAVCHQVRPLGVRPGPRDARRGLPRRRHRSGERHRRPGRRHALRGPERRLPRHPGVRPGVVRRGPPQGHRTVQAVPQGHRPARRGRRGAGPARPRPRRPGADVGGRGSDAVRGGRSAAWRTSSARPPSCR